MPVEPTCCAGPNELLRGILLGINELIGTGGVSESVNITTVGGVAASTGCGVSTTGTLRVAQATDCPVTVTGTVAVTGTVSIGTSVTPGTAATNLGKAEDSVAASGDVGVFALGVANEAQTTLAADGDYIAHSTDTKGNHLVVGNLANDAVDAGNPVKIGGRAMTTNPTAVADGDRVNAAYTKTGRAIVILGGPRELKVRGNITITASTAETTLLAAGAAGVFHDLEWITVSNTSGTATRVDFRDATAGAVQFSMQSPAGSLVGISLAHPIFQNTAASNWTAQSSVSVTDLRITTQAHKLN